MFVQAYILLCLFPIGSDGFAVNLRSSSLAGRSVVPLFRGGGGGGDVGRRSPKIGRRPIRARRGDDEEDGVENVLSLSYAVAGATSALSWIATSCVALSHHPDPRFAHCSLRHNVLTMGQAFAFPLPVLVACFETLRLSAWSGRTTTRRRCARLDLGVAAASAWLAASSALAPRFAFGYDLYGRGHKIASTAVHGIVALWSATQFLRRRRALAETTTTTTGSAAVDVGATTERRRRRHWFRRQDYALVAVGMLWFAVRPVFAPYPSATVPTILGKRLSRPASAFTLLGAIAAYDLAVEDDVDDRARDALRRGLERGSGAHLLLVASKLVGVDGGGLILPGDGLREVYPAMIAVPRATAASLCVHFVAWFAAFSERRRRAVRSS